VSDELALTGRRKLIFDGDGSQYTDGGQPCSLCGQHQTIGDPINRVFIRVREKLANGSSQELAHVCPDCVARMFLQVTRLNLWNQVSAVVMTAIKRLFEKRSATKAEPDSKPEPSPTRKALGNLPGPKPSSKGLDKLLPRKR
jgi:hypothetical protein